MKIYTKTGDDGTTGLFGGQRVDKDAARVDTYGSVDEANAVIGVARAADAPAQVDEVLASAQAHLFVVGAELASAAGKTDRLGLELIGEAQIAALERAIDAMEAELPALSSFILPGGTPCAAALHHARTVCRRAERALIALGRSEPVRGELVRYLNRLSDLLFVAARRASQLGGVGDVPWDPHDRGATTARSRA